MVLYPLQVPSLFITVTMVTGAYQATSTRRQNPRLPLQFFELNAIIMQFLLIF